MDNIVEFQPHISIITNITPDHLDHYNYQFENYIASKFRITSNQKSQHHLIYNEDDATTTTYLAEHPQMVQQYPISLKQKVANGAYVESGIIIWKSMQQDVSMLASKLALKGKHNQYNALMAGKVAQLLGISGTTIQKALGNFDSLEHRLETVTTIEEVVFINDSKATNIDAVWYALDAIDQPIVWIVGGVDKGNDYEVLMSLVQQKVKAIVCLGKDNSKIHQAFDTKQLKIVNTKSAKTAVKKAWKLAEKGDVVLLSPACASFDLFKNYIDRGKQFKKAVLDLKAKTEKTILVAI
ncbi:MAG: UDP-N-acetylmuramoyl-L-alanine--D-glutamate ligase [Chitinophagales bacterium]